MDNKYNNSKIYKIEPIGDYEEGDIYIGSTTKKYLCERMAEHRKDYKRWKNGIDIRKCMSIILFEKYGVENCQIVLLEHVNVLTKDELKSKEGFYIRTLNCVNKYIPDRTTKEWNKEYYIQNKETIDKKNKEYRETHKEKLSVYHKQYREEHIEHKKEVDKAYRDANKEKIKERKTQPFLCECGCTINWDEKARHRKSKKHINLMEQKQEQN